MTLEQLTIKEVIDGLTERVKNEFQVNSKQAKTLVLNALTYNIVVEEVLDQIAWMIQQTD